MVDMMRFALLEFTTMWYFMTMNERLQFYTFVKFSSRIRPHKWVGKPGGFPGSGGHPGWGHNLARLLQKPSTLILNILLSQHSCKVVEVS